MKKYYFLMVAMMMAVLTMGFSACGNDDKDEPKGDDIVGTWKLTGTEDGATYTTLIQFTNDSIFNDVEIWSENGETEVEVYKGTYTVSGNVLTITETDEDDAPFSYSMKFQVKEKQLILSDQGYSVTYNQANDSEIQRYL